MTKDIKKKYPIMPFISYGVVDDDKGLYISMPFKPISLNEYRRLHHGRIKKEVEAYKAVLDIIMVTVFKKNYIHTDVTEDGLLLTESFFKDKIDVQWILTFNTDLIRDPSNYTQKIMLDAIVKTGMIVDDSEQYVNSDHTSFGCKGFDSVTCVMLGAIKKHMVKTSYMNDIKHSNLLKNLEVI